LAYDDYIVLEAYCQLKTERSEEATRRAEAHAKVRRRAVTRGT